MKLPALWSMSIWRTLISTRHAPDYARTYWLIQRRQTGTLRRTTTQKALNCAYVTGLVIMATPCGWIGCFALIAFTSFGSLPMALIRASGFASLGGIGAAILASRTALAIRRLKEQRILDHWLMLPYPRRDLVLYGVAPAFEPAIFQISLAITEIAALLLGVLSLNAVLRDVARGVYDHAFGIPLMALVGWGTLLGLLVVEWIQWIALSVTVGVVAGFERRLGVPAAALYGLFVAVGRGAGGLLIALILDLPGRWLPLVIITGPLSGTVATPYNLIGITIAVLYLAGLEWVVRRLFGRAIHQIGEN